MKVGKVSENVLKRSVLRQIRTTNKQVLCGAGAGKDCAIFLYSEGEKAVSCVQEGILLGADSPETVTMTHLVQKCANNLAVSGGIPAAAMIALLLPEEAEESRLRALIAEAEAACASLGMQIAGGQTRVSRAVDAPVAVVTGYGKLMGKEHTAALARPGQDIVVSKWIALEGTALLAKGHRVQLLERYPGYLVEEAAGFDRYLSIVPEAAIAAKSGACAMHDASEGGIFAALWELAEGAGTGLTVDLKKIPLRQETVEVCEHCNVNPYQLKSGGCLVMTAEDGKALAEALKSEGIPAAVVGKITDSNDRIVINEEEVRYLDRPRTDEIYKKTGEDHYERRIIGGN